MQKNSSALLDFDKAVELARKDPAAFDQYRRDVIQAMIARAPEGNRQQLQRLQWRIDQERIRAPNATAACLKLYQMMWDSFAGERGLIETLHNLRNHGRSANRPLTSAEVLAFSRVESSTCDSD